MPKGDGGDGGAAAAGAGAAARRAAATAGAAAAAAARLGDAGGGAAADAPRIVQMNDAPSPARTRDITHITGGVRLSSVSSRMACVEHK